MSCGCDSCEVEDKLISVTCPPGKEMVDGECQIVSVTLDLSIDATHTFVEAATGKTIIEIRGIAFHDGLNKNGWSITKEGARFLAEQMIGEDLTLNHPDANENGPGFKRNMDGGVDKAVIGYISSASFHPTTNNGYEVRYIAHVLRPELFEALESGLWLREDYGVSIGGSGVPIQADEDGIIFGEDFTFDHLAIVHLPAYEKANIETAERIEKPESIKATLISHSHSATDNHTEKVTAMSEENISETVEETTDYEGKIEALKADLVLSQARVAEFETAESEREENIRSALVEKAADMGMSGHDDLKTETLENLIASWEDSHPVSEPVVMEAVDSTPTEEPVMASEPASEERVVANYLNGVLVSSEEGIYARCYNAWAKAWNGTLASDESEMRAKTFEEIKEMI